jgi:hypothetical protein
MCLIAEIIHTCSHEKVAQAAVASMGSDFAGKVGVTAGAFGLSIGAFAARAVREFEKSVGEPEKKALRAVMDRTDQPILTGLQAILQPIVEVEDPASELQALGRPANSRRADQKRPSPKDSWKSSKTVDPSFI